MRTLTRPLTALLSEALQNHRRVQVRPISDDLVEVRLIPQGPARRPIVLHAEEWKPNLRDEYPNDFGHLWVLRKGSTRILKQLRARRQNFVDLMRGNVYINLPDLLVDRVVSPTKRVDVTRLAQLSLTRPLVDPFADRASLLTRVLLESPGTTWTVTGLAEAAGVASMLSSHIVRQLAAAQIIHTEKQGRKLLVRLIAPRALLEAWAARYDWRRNTALPLAAPVGEEERFLHRFANLMKKRRWALTLLAGAWRRTRYAPADRLHAYVDVASDADLKELGTELGWTPDPSGQLVLMRPAYRTSVWHNLQRVRNAPVVSDLQLIVDLWHYPTRGRETAEQLFSRIEHGFERSARLQPEER
jgi:hypothetical protein